MNRKNNFLKFFLLLLITNLLTFTLVNFISIRTSSKVFLPREDYEKMISVYEENKKAEGIKDYINKNYLRPVDQEVLKEGQLKGLVQSLDDPYSVYLTEEEYASMEEETSGEFGGIGVVVSPGEDNLITVVSPIEGTPGERAGIRTGDKIIKVEGQEFKGENLDEAVKVMKGEPGTDVNLTLLREVKSGSKEMIDLKITREIIRVETVKGQLMEDNIGYIRISSFDKLTYKDFKENLDKLEKQGMEKLVIDLRNNPGGLLDVTAEIADDLLDKGTIVYMENKNGKREYINSDPRMVTYPLAVLVNQGSASASEVLSGAIKDHGRGKIIGQRTFGKGVVQTIVGFKDGSGLKLTISEYFTPSGTSIHGIGLEPDIVVDLDEGVRELGPDNLKEDSQLQEAIKYLKDQ